MSFGGYICKHSPSLLQISILTAIIRNAHFCSWTQVPVLAVVEWVQGGVVVVVTDSILTSSKVQSLSLLQLKRMHLMYLTHLLSPLSSGNFDAVRACCPAFLAHSRLFRCCTRKDSKQFPLSQVRSCLVFSLYARIAITFIVIDKGPALVVVAAVFRTSHISHTFESGGCRTS